MSFDKDVNAIREFNTFPLIAGYAAEKKRGQEMPLRYLTYIDTKTWKQCLFENSTENLYQTPIFFLQLFRVPGGDSPRVAFNDPISE